MNKNLGIMTKTVTILSRKIFFHMFSPSFCLVSKIVIIAEIFFINFLKTLIRRATTNFNKEQLKVKTF